MALEQPEDNSTQPELKIVQHSICTENNGNPSLVPHMSELKYRCIAPCPTPQTDLPLSQAAVTGST